MQGGDNTIIFNIQIAILGVVLVSAFFYLWRMIGRVEDRLERLERRIVQLVAPAPSSFLGPADEDIMEQIFGGAAAPSGDVLVTEEEPATAESMAEASPERPSTPVYTASCEITPATDDEVSTTSLSRTKIRKMTVEALRDLCKEKGLSPDGSRAQLMERLFAA